ncbi:unnamed protein product [Owenia fusiformis]|uniref:Uncharacterized protein n=1 Tax=Owenia fusiformis TaxID=6347 RepID=A0A8J1U796_OWEFU|nr:unnamed protein product [Owenia fusiformis]
MAGLEKVLGKFRELYKRKLIAQTIEGVLENREVIETDYCKNAEDLMAMLEDERNSYGVFEHQTELKQCVELAHKLYASLHQARVNTLECEILIPSQMLRKISQDVMRMCANEPYGWRGCVLYLTLEENNLKKTELARIELDPTTVATFELSITIHEEPKFHIRKILPNFRQMRIGCSRWGTLVLSQGFTIAKHKLYIHNSKWETYSH